MSRILERDAGPIDIATEEASTGRTTARSLATAIALLIVSILVVTRSRAAFEPLDADASASLAAGTVALTDDDSGSSLFAIDDMVPGRPEADCIVVSYDGNVLPVTVSLASEAEGSLAGVLDVLVERGTGGTFHNCGGFTPDGVVYQGTLEALSAEQRGVEAFTVTDAPDAQTFRFTFTLDGGFDSADGGAGSGLSGSATTVPTAEARFAWTADPTSESDN